MRLPIPVANATLEAPLVFHDCTALVSNGVTASKFAGDANDPVVATIGGRSCIQFGPNTGVSSNLLFTAAAGVNVQGRATVSILVYCTDFKTLSSFNVVALYFDNGGSVDATNYLLGQFPCSQVIDGNWHLMTYHFSAGLDFTAGYTMTKAGTATTTAQRITAGLARRVQIQVAGGAGKPDFYVGGIWFGGRKRPKVILGYDGCYISQKAHALVAHDLYGIPGTLYVTKHKVGTAATFLSDADLDTFYAKGWAIAQHSYTNTDGWDAYASTQAIVDEIGTFQTWQASRGFTRGLGHACWPYVAPGSMSAANRTKVFDAIRQSGLLKTIRNADHAGASGALNCNNLTIDTLHIPFAPRQVWSPQGVQALTAAQVFDRSIKQPICAGQHAHVYVHEMPIGAGAGGGNGIDTPWGTNYWLKSNYDAFMVRISSYLKSGMCGAGTIAEYD
jgi:hypothetical protein